MRVIKHVYTQSNDSINRYMDSCDISRVFSGPARSSNSIDRLHDGWVKPGAFMGFGCLRLRMNSSSDDAQFICY